MQKQTDKKYVYLVRQTQPVDNYDEKTIAVYNDRQKAVELARALNREYARGVILDDNFDFVMQDDDYDYDFIHYYDIDCQEVNPAFEIFGVNQEVK